MNNHSKQDVVTALSKLPTDVLVQLMHLYQESNREKLKKSDAESVFIISNIPEKVQEEVKEYEMMGDTQLGQHNKKWVSTIKNLPHCTTALPILDMNFLSHVDNVWEKKISGLETIKDKLIPHFTQYLQSGVSRPIILSGIPGCGKTRVMNTVGEILNLPVHISNAVQMATGNGLTGHSNAYLAALPGEVVEGMTTLHCGNFVFGIDEIDKAHMIADRSGNFQSELLSLTSDETSHNFKDNFLGFPIDASHLFIIMTANELDNLSEPLKSRCDIIEFPEPDANTIAAILAEHTVPSFLDKLRCNGKVIVDNNSVSYLVDTLYPKCKDIRKYQGIIESAISQSFLLAMRSDKQATVDANTIKPLVDSVFAKQSIRIGF